MELRKLFIASLVFLTNGCLAYIGTWLAFLSGNVVIGKQLALFTACSVSIGFALLLLHLIYNNLIFNSKNLNYLFNVFIKAVFFASFVTVICNFFITTIKLLTINPFFAFFSLPNGWILLLIVLVASIYIAYKLLKPILKKKL